jgi:hypothetical protein
MFGDGLKLEVTGHRLIVATLIGTFVPYFHCLFKFEKSPNLDEIVTLGVKWFKEN